MTTDNDTARRPKQIDRRTICLGDVLPDVSQALKSGKARNLSALVRASLRAYLHGEQRTVDMRPVVAALEKLRADMARVGGNLNQIAHVANERGPVALAGDALPHTLEELRGEFREVMTKIAEVERGFRRASR